MCFICAEKDCKGKFIEESCQPYLHDGPSNVVLLFVLPCASRSCKFEALLFMRGNVRAQRRQEGPKQKRFSKRLRRDDNPPHRASAITLLACMHTGCFCMVNCNFCMPHPSHSQRMHCLAGGAGGGTTYNALRKADEAWKRLRTAQVPSVLARTN